MKKAFLAACICCLLLGSVHAQTLLEPAPAGKSDAPERSHLDMLKTLFNDNRFVGGYFLYLTFFHDFNIQAMESHSKVYKPEVSRRLIYYCLNGLDQVNDELANNYFDRGLARMDSGRYEQSMNDFDHMLLYDPHNSDAYVNRAILFIISAQYKEALEEITKAKLYGPKNPAVFFNTGVIAFNQGRLADALKAEDSCILLQPDYSRAWFEKGLILNSMNQHEQAIKALRKARSYGDTDAGELIRKIKESDKEQEKNPKKMVTG